MPPKSISKKIFKFVHKLKQLPWQAKNPTRNWLDLPPDLMLNILQRVGVVDILQNVQKVCTAWRDISKDPAMWKVVYLDAWLCQSVMICQEMCKQAVDRSQGQLVDLRIIGYCDQELLKNFVDGSSQLRHLAIIIGLPRGGFGSEASNKLSILEKLTLVSTGISHEHIEVVGRCCPLLKTLKLYLQMSVYEDNQVALAIGKYLPQLTHLQLIWSGMGNIGLQAILDGCCHLESLDLRGCWLLELNGDLGKRISQQVKHLKLPHDSCEDLLDCLIV